MKLGRSDAERTLHNEFFAWPAPAGRFGRSYVRVYPKINRIPKSGNQIIDESPNNGFLA
jgi:hypothetical protein